MARKCFLALCVLGVVAWFQPPLAGRPPACAIGRFVADDAVEPVFELRDGTVALPGRCPPTRATFAAPRRTGVPLRASWSGCPAHGRLQLRGRITADCTAFRGVLVDGASHRPFAAHRVPVG